MSNEESKIQHSRRRQQTDTHIAKQKRIAESHGIDPKWDKDIRQPHRYNKHHAMDCGNPKCVMCSNPRKIFSELTIQEQRMFQEKLQDE